MDTLSLALRFSADPSRWDNGKYLSLRAEVCELAADGSPRNIGIDYPGDARPFAGLVITAQADRGDDRADYPPEYAYAWRYGVQTSETMPYETLTAVAKTLAKVSRKLDAATAQYGSPATFGAFVARIAAALAMPVLFGRSGSDGFYTSGEWQTVSSGDAVGRIDAAVRAHRAA